MKTTAMGVILDPTEEQKQFLDDLMARYCAARGTRRRRVVGIQPSSRRLEDTGRQVGSPGKIRP